MSLTLHAQARKCQRSIPSYVVTAAYECGTHSNVRGSAHSYTLDRGAIEMACEHYPRSIAVNLDRYLGVYLVIGDNGNVVTVARGKARFPRH